MFRTRCLLALLMFVLVPFFAHAEDEMSVTYQHRTLHLNVPFHGLRAGAGRLVVDLLSPEDEVLAHVERDVNAGDGSGAWKVDVAAPEAVAFDELVWERVRVRFTQNGEQDAAVSETRTVADILRRPVLQLLGQEKLLAGSEAALRIYVSDGTQEAAPVGSGTVRVELVQKDMRTQTLFTGKIDRRGTVDAVFRLPQGLVGDASLRIVAETPIGETETTQGIELVDKVSILLTTEKPVYQPSQTIHIRALALDKADHHAAAERAITFEMEDARGNKVFRKQAETDAFGVASAELPLADEVNLGAWHLRATMPSAKDGGAVSNSELTLRVDKYVLPKFRVTVKFAEKDGVQQRDFRPGDHVTGTVEARYFFGEPVSNSALDLKIAGFDAKEFEAAAVHAKTDANGKYAFDLTLPTYFAGRADHHGAAPVVVEASVKDNAGHTEEHDEPITVTDAALLIQAIPEAGQMVPGLENVVYVLTSYPDGTPAQTTVRLHTKSGTLPTVETGKDGVATVRIQGTNAVQTLHAEASDGQGKRAETNLHLEPRSGSDQVLLRTDRAVYRHGDTMKLSVIATSADGSAYVDVVANGQTVETRDIDIKHGRAELSVPVTPALAGTVEIDAYMFGEDSRVVRDERLAFVQPADELHIEAQADAASYLPGADARVRFHVTDAHGKGVEAALGLEVVDEAVFALAEKQPGFAKVFFYLEQELLKPRVEVHAFSQEEIVVPEGSIPVEGLGEAESDASDHAARVLFAAAQSVDPHTMHASAGEALPQKSRADFQARYQAEFEDKATELAVQLRDRVKANGQSAETAFAGLRDARDAWETPIRMVKTSWGRDIYSLQSAGADREFNTDDDLSVQIDVAAGEIYSPWKGHLSFHIDHARGAMNGAAEASGCVHDPTGAVIPGAAVTVEAAANHTIRHMKTNADGCFDFAGLTPAAYRMQIVAAGFVEADGRFTVAAQDSAVVSAVLNVGDVLDTVEVSGAVDMMRVEALPMRARVINGMAAGVGMGAARSAFTLAAPMNAKLRSDAAAEADHTRSFFPEALFIAPELITDSHGNAEVSIPMADSITTWRMAMMASTKAGALGSGTSSLKVFQDFFVDLDLPVTLTVGDRISIPVAVYNYTAKKGDVQLKLEGADWFSPAEDDSAEKFVSVEANAVGGTRFTIAVKHAGTFHLTIAASMGAHHDTMTREIEVVPNGERKEMVANGRMDGAHDATATQSVSFPAETLPDSTKMLVRFYPGPMSQIAEGMDGVLRMPYGCFEQTSSSTYPNVLALDYMKRTKKLTPEIHAKAEGFITTGYQRLLTFEVAGGGFSWFGQAPANKILTAYGLMEFHDMSAVHDVDPRVIARTRDWLISQQQADGSWKADTQFINEGATNRFNSDVVRITAYIAWALENTGYDGPALAKARGFLRDRVSENAKLDAYTLAVLANFAVDGKGDGAWTREVMQRLMAAAQREGENVYWSAEETGMYGRGTSAAVETTGLAVQALLKWGEENEAARKALTWLLAKKSGDGNWGSTQATIMALRALVMASEKGGGDAVGDVDVLLNGERVGGVSLTRENNDLLQQVSLPAGASGRVEMRFKGTGALAYQVASRYYVPWHAVAAEQALTIDVAYDRSKVAENDVISATATVKNHTDARADMVMVDLGIPPGFELLTEDLQSMADRTAHAKSGKLEKFSLTATQAILYFDAVDAGKAVKIGYRLRAKYPVRAQGFASKAYEYYDPAVAGTASPQELEVRSR